MAALDELRRDVAYGARMLRKYQGFSAVAVVTLALGIGANTAVFSVVDTVVFRPLPYADPDQLLKLCGTGPNDRSCDDDFSLPELRAVEAQQRVFAQVAADNGTASRMTRADGSRANVGVGMVTVNWLATLGVRPLIGRDFASEEGRPGQDGVALLTHEGWRRHFGSEANVVGTKLSLDGAPVTVIGVLPPNVLRSYADLLRPLVLTTYPQGPGHRDLDVFGRLRPGVTVAQARAELDLVAQRLEEQYRDTNASRRFGVQPLGKYYAPAPSRAGPALVLMLGAVGLVLLIACANVAGLLLARAAARRRECVVRAALGASRARLVRQLLIENMLLFLTGGALGVLLASASLDALTTLALAGGYVPERMEVAMDTRVLAVSLLASVLTGLVFGLAPALQASRVDLIEGLHDSGRGSSGPGRARARRLLVAAELSLSLVLLVGFGLLIRSFLRVHATSGGFDASNLLEAESDGGRSFPEAVDFWRGAVETARAIPGVAQAALTSRPPMHGARRQRFQIEGRPPSPQDEAVADVLVSADYFATMGIPLLRGRAFSETDDGGARPVLIVSQAFARRYFPDQDPVGRHVSLNERSPMSCCAAAGPVEGVLREIVGVVGDVRQANLDEDPALTLYRPYTQIVEHDMYLMTRARSAPDVPRVAAELRSRLAASSHEWSDVRAMRDVIRESESIRLRRFALILLGSFAGAALLLAAVGTYGVTAGSVAERTKELGVRMALGATHQQVFRQILGETVTLALLGVGVGSLAALASTRLIAAMLFGVTPTDAGTYACVSLLLVVVVVLAGYFPALRATRVDPITALRHE